MKKFKSFIGVLLAAAVTLSPVCTNVAFAATQNESSVVNAENAIEKGDIHSLVSYYLSKNADYYHANALKPGCVFFNADNYIKANPDVAAVASSKEAALEHYLTYGAFEGRSCGTAFDPIVEIKANPEGAKLSPDALFTAWFAKNNNANINTSSEVANTALNQETSAPSSEAVKPAAISDKSFTLLAYVCGSDLESRDGIMEASKAIVKILLGAYEQDNSNALILAGGTDKWKNDYLQELLGGRVDGCNKSAIFAVNKDGLREVINAMIANDDSWNSVDDIYKVVDKYDKEKEDDQREAFAKIAQALINEKTMPVLEGSLGTNKMADPNTLVSLLNAGKNGEYKADSYALSLWNHGGGSLEGVCFPEENKSKGLTIPEIKKALDEAGYGSTSSSKENKIGLLAFDACLMSGVETAAYLSNYYDMMYASEEITSGDIDYYHLLKNANQKVGDADLSHELAKAVFMDRSENYLGTYNLTSTAALFKSGMAEESIVKFNELAKILNVEAENHSEVYAAIKNARLKCEQFAADGGSVDTGKEYVDMKNFLQMLKIELNDYRILGDSDSELCRAINDAIKASDLATYANAYNYGYNRVFYKFDGGDVYVNKAFWDQIKGMDLCGANVFVPYYSKDRDTVSRYLAAFNENYVESLSMGDYNTLVNNYVEYLDSDKDRVKKLTDALISGYDDGNADATVPGYADLIDMSLKTAEDKDYLSIEIKKYENEKYSKYSSGDAFVDLCETMNTMVVYITRKAKAMCESNGENVSDYYIDIVVGSKTISYENINGLQSAVNVFTDSLSEEKMNVVKETTNTWNEETQEYEATDTYDFITPSDMEGFLEKDNMVDKIKTITGNTKEYKASNWMTAKGTAKTDSEAEAIPVYHIFEKDDDGNFCYRGSVMLNLNEETGKYEVGESVDAKYITFYHQTVNTETNKLVYAEEYSWNEGDNSTINVSKLYGTKEYDVTNKADLTISGARLGNVGSVDDNKYYFAISQKSTPNSEDVIANASATSENYDATPENDIFAAVDTAMNTPADNTENNTEESEDVCKSAEDANIPNEAVEVMATEDAFVEETSNEEETSADEVQEEVSEACTEEAEVEVVNAE